MITTKIQRRSILNNNPWYKFPQNIQVPKEQTPIYVTEVLEWFSGYGFDWEDEFLYMVG
jgi:hypothetical protein